jgi:hypothetical protein
MLRSIGAVLAGFIVMAITIIVGTIALTAVLIPGGIATMRSPQPGGALPTGYLTANLTLSFLAAVLGGYLTVRLAASAPVIHALALGTLLMVMGIVTAAQAGGAGSSAGQPSWYPWVITTLGVVGVMAGGMLRARP